jgi:hypothetical protein
MSDSMFPEVIIGISLLVITFFVAAYDIYALIKWGTQSTVSVVMYSWAKSYPILPLMIGLLMGHVFWRE